MTKLLRLLVPFVAVAGALSWSQPWVSGADLWWHLASGREISARGAVPSTDIFSFTFAGREWMNHEWLWDVVYWGVYHRIGPEAVAWFHLGVVALLFALVYAVAFKESRSMFAAGAVLWLAAATMYWFIDIRPHVYTLVIVSAFLLTRDRRWAPFVWPPSMVIWVNLHGGFLFGLGMIGLHVLVRAIEAGVRERRLVVNRREWICVGLCFLAMLANPWGYRILEYPMEYLVGDSPYHNLIEWNRTELSLDPLHYGGRFLFTAILAAAGALLAARRARYLLALSIVTCVMACTSRRFIPLFAVTSAPMAALAVAWGVDRMVRWRSWIGSAPVGYAATAVAAALAVLLWQDVRLTPRLLERWTESAFFPDAALRYLRALGTPRRIFNEYRWGGYVMLHAPGLEVFIDGRANTLYDDRIYRDYCYMLGGGLHPRQVLRRYPADAALLPPSSTMTRMLRTGDGAWVSVYRDPVACILVPPDSPVLKRPLPDPLAVLGDHADRYILQAQLALNRGDRQAALELAEAARKRDPLLPRVHGLVALIHMEAKDMAAVDRTLERAYREMPRGRKKLKPIEAKIFEAAGDLDRAIAAYRAAVPMGPFEKPEKTLRTILELERKRRRSRMRESRFRG
jgi:tetratricopeptide (TPR) repeat protein